MKGTFATGRLSLSVIPSAVAILMPTVPVAVPTVTGTVQVAPLPIGVPIVAPVEPVPVIAKCAAVTPVTASLNVTV